MNKCLSHIIYNAEGERVCSKIGGGFALAAITPSSTQNFLVNDETQVATDLWTMVKRGVECSGFPVENIDIKKELPSAENLNDDAEINQYFYHSDHLGSSSFITDATGNATQHLQYLAFGETWIDQQSGSFDSRYKFSAKELDDETSYSYFGARYYDSDLSVWLSVDPLSDKYPNLSPYAYCANNPVMHRDPNGMEIDPTDSESDIALNNHVSSFGTDKMSGEKLFGLKKQDNGRYTSSLRMSEKKFNKRMDKAELSGDKRKDAMDLYKALQSPDVMKLRSFEQNEKKSDFLSKGTSIDVSDEFFMVVLESFFKDGYLKPSLLEVGGKQKFFDPKLGHDDTDSNFEVYFKSNDLAIIQSNSTEVLGAVEYYCIYAASSTPATLKTVFSIYFDDYGGVPVKTMRRSRISMNKN